MGRNAIIKTDGSLNYDELGSYSDKFGILSASIGVQIGSFPRISPEVVDNPRVQRALNSMTNGGFLVFEASTYSYNGTTITFPQNKISLLGKYKATLFQLTNGASTGFTNSAWFYASAKDGIMIEAILFDGNGANQTTLFDILSLSQCTNVKLDKLHFENGYGSCMNLNQSTDYIVSNITIKNITGTTGNPGEGIYALGSQRGTISNVMGYGLDDHLIYLDGISANQTQDIDISNCIGVNCGRATGSSAFNIFKNCTRIHLDNCHAYSCGMGFTANSDGSSLYPTDITYSDCTAYNSNASASAHGFLATGITGGVEMRLKYIGCRAYGCGGGTSGIVAIGFYFQDVIDIEMDSVDAIKNNDDGVRFARCKKVRWTGGTVRDNSRRTASPAFQGVRIGDSTGTMSVGACDDYYISEIRTTDTATTGKLQNYGFYIENNSTNVTIQGGKHDGNATGAWVKDSNVVIATNINKDGTLGAKTSVGNSPDFIGQTAVVNGIGYTATGTSSSGDWKRSTIGGATGNTTMNASATSVTVNHGLPSSPSIVTATPQGNIGSVWINNITATQFTINCSTAPASNTTMSWKADV